MTDVHAKAQRRHCFFVSKEIYYQIFHNTWVNTFFFLTVKYYFLCLEFIFPKKKKRKKKKIFFLKFQSRRSLILRHFSHPITVANLLSQQLPTARHHRSVGGKPLSGRCIIPSERAISPLLPSLLPAFSSPLFHLAQWRSAISTTLIQSQPACQSRQDTTPTAIPSPLITQTGSHSPLFAKTVSNFSSLSPSPFSSPPFLHSLSVRFSHFYFPSPLPFLLISSRCFPSSIFHSPSLSASSTYGRKAAQAQGNGINFHSRLNSQSISLELNTLPPIRESQGSISPFPRRHSPAIQRQPRQPCLTF